MTSDLDLEQSRITRQLVHTLSALSDGEPPSVDSLRANVRRRRRRRRTMKVAGGVVMSTLIATAVVSLVRHRQDANPPTGIGDTAVDVRSSVFGPQTDQPSVSPVGREWRQTQAWWPPAGFWKDEYDLYQEAIRVCMADRGFNFRKWTYDGRDDLLGVRMNPLNDAVAKVYGYDTPEEPIPDPNRDASVAFQTALGSPNGCANTAVNFSYNGTAGFKLSGDLASANASLDQSLAGYTSTTDRAERVAAWNSCMVKRGYRIPSPEAASTKYSSRGVTELELSVRLTDIACDKQVGLTAARSEYERSMLEEWTAAHQDLIDDLKRDLVGAQEELANRARQLQASGIEALDENQPQTSDGGPASTLSSDSTITTANR